MKYTNQWKWKLASLLCIGLLCTQPANAQEENACLLYTSDAADDSKRV